MTDKTVTSFDRRPRKVGSSELVMKNTEGSRSFTGHVATQHGYVIVQQGRPLYGPGWTQLHFIYRGRVYERRFSSALFSRAIVARARAFAAEVRNAK